MVPDHVDDANARATHLPAQRLEVARTPPLLLLVLPRLGGEELVDLDVGQDGVLRLEDLHLEGWGVRSAEDFQTFFFPVSRSRPAWFCPCAVMGK